MRFFKTLASISVLAALAAGLALYLYRPAGVEVRRVRFESIGGRQLVGDYYLPEKREGLLPAVLLCHGVEANKEVMGHMGIEFARRGFAALSFDYGGYGESDPHGDELSLMIEDTFSALRRLYLEPETRGEGSTALVGHSMGVTYAVGLAGMSPDSGSPGPDLDVEGPRDGLIRGHV